VHGRPVLNAAIVSVMLLATAHAREEGQPAVLTPDDLRKPPGDWLLTPSPFKARVLRSQDQRELVLTNGLVRRVFRLTPNCAGVALENMMTSQNELRSVRPEAVVELDGTRYDVGGLIGQPVHNYLKTEWLETMRANPAAFAFAGYEVVPVKERFAWKKRREWMPADLPWPPPGVGLTLAFKAPESVMKPAARPAVADASISVHYELYDGIPLLAKWITVANGSKQPLTVNSFICEILACVEPESPVDLRSQAMFRHDLRNFTVDSDFSFQSMDRYSQHHAIHWKSDPLYETQVNYARQTPCLLECHPPTGPDAVLNTGESFESFRVFELFFDGEDRERRGLAVRRMYRALAPWVTENPTLMHVRGADPKSARLAIDQCAEVGFEMVIMTFGSGFNIENEDPKYLEQIKELADYAHSKGIALGGYSLLASRSVGPDDDVCNPATGKPGGFAVFGSSPCLGSKWGQDYFRKLYQFYEKTGADILEHDGSYPGDVCASAKHPGHRGLKDSQWRQWRTIAEFYQWCRGHGVYLNVPDFYYLAGSSKCGMGYRETNWSLPRAEQEIIERQNIWDGTWEKTPSMGWMFVPLTEYHGGGKAATIEPLCDHLDHYETRLANLFGAGVKACYRGPRLYDTDATKAVVKKWVDWYGKYRAILDSDIIHGRRADGRDVDWIMHANPSLKERGLVMVYNPLSQDAERSLTLPLYYTGLTDTAKIRQEEGTPQSYTLTRDYKVTVPVKVPARGRTWLVIEAP